MKHSACLPLCLGILLTTLFPSCVRDDEEEPPAELVVEGWIEEGGFYLPVPSGVRAAAGPTHSEALL